MKNLIILATILSMLFGQSVSARTYDTVFNPKLPVKAVTNTTTDAIYLELLDRYSVQIFSMGFSGIGLCTGTLIAEVDGKSYILTCRHCGMPAEEVWVEDSPVKTIMTSVKDDLTLLVVEGKIKNKLPIPGFADSEVGDKVSFVGHPDLVPDKVYARSGRIIRKTIDWYWAELESIGGCSGSGVFNNSSYLTAILWGGTPGGIVVMESAQDIIHFLSSLGIKGLIK